MSLLFSSKVPGVAMSTAAHAHGDVPAWVRYHGELSDRFTDDGDLILDLRDFNDQHSLVASGALDRWADYVGYDLDRMDRHTGLLLLNMRTLYPFLGQVGSDHPLMPSVRAALRGGEPSENIRLKVRKDFVIRVFTEVADGPFATSDELLAALERRTRCVR